MMDAEPVRELCVDFAAHHEDCGNCFREELTLAFYERWVAGLQRARDVERGSIDAK
jgi:hypothetical protein